MRLLLDTHVFLWWTNEPEQLSKIARKAIEDASSDIFVSDVSLWEIVIKTQIGKLTSLDDLRETIALHQANGVEFLSITQRHILEQGGLPLHHRDPFDRLLIATALSEGITFVTADRLIAQYPVTILW